MSENNDTPSGLDILAKGLPDKVAELEKRVASMERLIVIMLSSYLNHDPYAQKFLAEYDEQFEKEPQP